MRETNHRCSNDLQLVISLLAIQSRRATSDEVRQALNDAMERVMVLARARSTMLEDLQPTLEAALRQVCEALHAQAEPRSISVSLKTTHDVTGLSARQITTLALVANELATNAIKHAYREGTSGHIRVAIDKIQGSIVKVSVDDDGLPFPEPAQSGEQGIGLGLAKRLMTSIGGAFVAPDQGSKTFELRVPLPTS